MALALVGKRKNGAASPGNDVAMLAAQIAAVREETTAAQAEMARLHVAAHDELDDDKAERLLAEARAADRRRHRAEVRLADLLAQHAEATWQRRQATFIVQKTRLEAAAREAMLQIGRAAETNAALSRAWDEARTAVGAEAAHFFEPLTFRGLLLPDLVAMWRDATERSLAAMATRHLTRPPAPPAPRPFDPKAPPPTVGDIGRGRAISLTRSISEPPPTRPPTGLSGGAVRLDEPPPPRLRAPRPPRHDPPAAAGEAQLVFIRSGVELPDGTQSVVGDKINLPTAPARRLVENGAADFAEVTK